MLNKGQRPQTNDTPLFDQFLSLINRVNFFPENYNWSTQNGATLIEFGCIIPRQGLISFLSNERAGQKSSQPIKDQGMARLQTAQEKAPGASLPVFALRTVSSFMTLLRREPEKCPLLLCNFVTFFANSIWFRLS